MDEDEETDDKEEITKNTEMNKEVGKIYTDDEESDNSICEDK
jgi:hypothetical protein